MPRIALVLLISFAPPLFAGVAPRCQSYLVGLESARTQRSTEVEAFERRLGRLQAELDDLLKRAGPREKMGRIGRWIGGDVDLISTLRERKSAIERSTTELTSAREALAEAEAAVVAKAKLWLIANQRDFAYLVEHRETLCPIVDVGASCVTTIDEAIKAVDSARTYDLWAGASDNKGLEFAAAMKTSTANEKIAAVQASVSKFRRALDEYQLHGGEHGVRDADHLRTVDYLQQLFVDCATNTGFMDIVNFFKLGEELKSLKTLRTEIARVHGLMVAVGRDLDRQIEDRIAAARAGRGSSGR